VDEPARDEPAADEPIGIEALYEVAAEAQQEDDVEEVEQPGEEWLAARHQAPEPNLEPRPRRRIGWGAVAPAPRPAKKVKNIASKGDGAGAVRRHSSRLSEAKSPPAK
jgi:hypothetical protein